MTARHRAFDEWLSLALAALGTCLVSAIFYASWPSDMSNPRHRIATGPHGHAHYVRPTEQAAR